MTVVDELRAFIIKELRWKGALDALTPEFPLIEHGVIDSLGLFMIVSFIREQFGVSIGYEELNPQDFATLSAIADLIDRRRPAPTD